MTICLGALAFGVAGCFTDPGAQIAEMNGTPSPPSPTVACEPGTPLKLKPRASQAGVTIVPSRCPISKPRDVGHSEKIYLGSVLAAQPCKELPDFAGSWWRPQPPYPKHLRKLGHEAVRGTMTLVAEGGAEFVAPAVQMEMKDHTMRIPPKGRLGILFTRIKGPAHVGGCD